MLRVLLVDDEPSLRLTMAEFLKRAGYAVISAADFESASLLGSGGYDVAVVDINLPGRSGLDVLHALKDEGTAMRVLVVSMYPEDQYAIRALRAGAYGYVNKGGDPALIVSAVRTVAQAPFCRTVSSRSAPRSASCVPPVLWTATTFTGRTTCSPKFSS